MKTDKYKEIVESLFQYFSSFKKGDTVPWDNIERTMDRHRDDLGGRQIVKRLIRDLLKRRHITCLVIPEIGIRLLTDMETAIKIPTMRQKRAKKQVRKGLKETENVDRQNLTERAMLNLAVQRRAMRDEQRQIAQSIKETEVLLKPSRNK
jgi:hypothetical protein